MPDCEDIRKAADRIRPYIHRTPLLTSSFLDALTGCKIFFKCENFQKTGSFKARGAMNSVLKLSEQEAARGVATHSSGNHGQALAWAAANRGIKATIVMPSNAPRIKREAVTGYGAKVVECAPNLRAREKTLEEVRRQTGAVFIPPYNYLNTIEGQATAALEILQENAAIDYIFCPVGGGGILSGTALSASCSSTDCRVIGCEPEAADDAFRSFTEGRLIPAGNTSTIADGLRTSLGDLTFPIIRELVDEILLCSEAQIVEAMKLIWQRMKIVVEPSGAAGLACLMQNKRKFRGKRIAIILTGGNVDLKGLPF